MRALEPAIWLELERGGAVVDACCGADDDPFGGVVHNRLPDESEIDVMPAKWKREALVSPDGENDGHGLHPCESLGRQAPSDGHLRQEVATTLIAETSITGT